MHGDDIVRCARGFLGARFAHQGRSAAQGLDCLGLLIVTAQMAGCRFGGQCASALDQRDYGHRPDTARLQAKLASYLLPVEGTWQPGDVLLLRIGGRPQHLALVSDYPAAGAWGMIHAYAPARQVVEHRLDESWRAAVEAVYRLPQVDEEFHE